MENVKQTDVEYYEEAIQELENDIEVAEADRKEDCDNGHNEEDYWDRVIGNLQTDVVQNKIALKKVRRAIKDRLECIREELRAERISYGELVELGSLKEFIDSSDIELLQAIDIEEA